MQKISHNHLAGNFAQSSDIHSFKALLPLILVKPRNIPGISLTAVYDILHPFINRRNDKLNKDYLRNTFSRLRTSLKEQTGAKYHSVFE